MYYVPLKFVSNIGDEVTSGRGPYERDLLQLLYPLFDSEISTSAELFTSVEDTKSMARPDKV